MSAALIIIALVNILKILNRNNNNNNKSIVDNSQSGQQLPNDLAFPERWASASANSRRDPSIAACSYPVRLLFLFTIQLYSLSLSEATLSKPTTRLIGQPSTASGCAFASGFPNARLCYRSNESSVAISFTWLASQQFAALHRFHSSLVRLANRPQPSPAP